MALGPVRLHRAEQRVGAGEQRGGGGHIVGRRIDSQRAGEPGRCRHCETRGMDEGKQLQQIEPGNLGIAQPLPDQRRVEQHQRPLGGERDRLAALQCARRPAPLGEPDATMGGVEGERRQGETHESSIGRRERKGNTAGPASSASQAKITSKLKTPDRTLRASCMTDTPATAPDLRTAALASKAWPYEEARKLMKRWPEGKADPMLFQTGYGPSGLPHIGTFTEVARTSMVRNAYEEMTGGATRLIAFSDDMDGMRKVPGNLPNPDMLHQHLDQPLSRVPDPFGTHDSFAAHNNARLRHFLDQFGFDYEFIPAHEAYGDGRFDETLKAILRRYDKIMGVMLPTLGEERRKTYSPIFPIHPESGKVLQVPIEVVDAEAGVIAYIDPDTGQRREQSVLGGQAKAQWKVDWALRWVAFGVDYEMAGKDLIDSVIQSGKIARVLGATPPDGFNYEMFLDEDGAKISKTKGNGLTIEEWLTYAPIESLAFYIYREPKKARQLSFSVIPRAVDEYYQFLGLYPDQPIEQKLGNPVHHVHLGQVPAADMPVTFGLLLNLVSVALTEDKALLWRYL